MEQDSIGKEMFRNSAVMLDESYFSVWPQIVRTPLVERKAQAKWACTHYPESANKVFAEAG
jgi:hypothetical protein